MMDDFEPISPILEGFYHLDYAQLPADIQERVSEVFFPIPWGRVSPEQRKSLAEGFDYSNDPATEPERQRISALCDKERQIKQGIERWSNVSTPTAQDLALKEEKLKALYRQRDEVEATFKTLRGDYLDACDTPSEALEDLDTTLEKGKREQQIQAIVDAAIKKNWNPLKIPDLGRALLRDELCKSLPELFTPAGFGHAWKAAKRQGRVKMANHDNYVRRR